MHNCIFEGYAVSRSDWENRIGWGVLLYSHLNIPTSESLKFDEDACEALFCRFVAAELYWPPDAVISSFKNSLDFLSDDINITIWQFQTYDNWWL